MATQTHVVVTNKTNGLGTAGLILAILGWFTCGLLCIPAVVVSLLALLFSPRGSAVAGLVVAFPGTLFFLFLGMGLLASVTGFNDRVAEARKHLEEMENAPVTIPNTALPSITPEQTPEPTPQPQAETSPPTQEIIEATPNVAPATPNVAPDPVPEPVLRQFTDTTGKFRVTAYVLSIDQNTITLQRSDNLKKVTIAIAKLSPADQAWIADNRAAVDSAESQN